MRTMEPFIFPPGLPNYPPISLESGHGVKGHGVKGHGVKGFDFHNR